MTKYCSELKDVSGTTGGGWVATGKQHRDGSISVPVGAMVFVPVQSTVLRSASTNQLVIHPE
jgi:GTPase involved in cell partitioning and DNA repair